MLSVIRYSVIITSVLLLIIALATTHWQYLSLKQMNFPHTNIGLWKTCTTHKGNKITCHRTEMDTEHDWELNCIRFLAILAIIGLLILCFMIYKKVNKDLVLLVSGLTLVAAGLVPFLYATEAENYFSQGFDTLMLSKYGYSFYLQCTSVLLILISTLISCYLS